MFYFSKLSQPPNDKGMATLAGIQNYNEFELHACAILGLPIPEINLLNIGASAVVLASKEGGKPNFNSVAEVLENSYTDVKIFNKPTTRPYQSMAVVVCNKTINENVIL